MYTFRTTPDGEKMRLKRHYKMNIKSIYEKYKTWQDEREEKKLYRIGLAYQLKVRKNEYAAQRIAEDYLTNIVSDYPSEDGTKNKLRNDLVQTQQQIKNLELVISWLKKQ